VADDPVIMLLKEIREEQRAARTRSDRLTDRVQRLAEQVTRSIRRTDDAMAAQTKTATDIAAIRATLEDGEHKLVAEFREDLHDRTG